ncbi:MAG TPA: hypothetical protein VMP00_16445 [Burkholderiales bacterium]|nr:hypothetical protein [Burkholderiales bacterium]
MDSGEIYRHARFYADRDTGAYRAKYPVFLAQARGGDWVARLLTSRENMRPRDPRCSHADPYPGYFLGIPGAPLELETWVDLRAFDDVDAKEAQVLIRSRAMRFALRLAPETLADILECTAGGPDTTLRQEKALRDRLAGLR